MANESNNNQKYERDKIIIDKDDSKFNRIFNPHHKVRESIRQILQGEK